MTKMSLGTGIASLALIIGQAMHTVKLFAHASGNFHEGETATHTGYVAKHQGQGYGGDSGRQRAAALVEGITKTICHCIAWSTHSPQMLRAAEILLSYFYTTLQRIISHEVASAVSLGCMLPPKPGNLEKRGEQWHEEEVCTGLRP